MRPIHRIAVLAAALFLAGCSEDLPQGDPSVHASMGRLGLREHGSVAIAIDTQMKPRFLQHAVSGWNAEHQAIPKSIEILPELSGCSFPRPEAGAKIVYLSARSEGPGAGVMSFGDAQVESAASGFIEQWRDRGREPRAIAFNFKPDLRLTNVVVTETSAPVHLVLGSTGKTLYNILVAPGARISGVSLIAAHDSAIANLPSGVPVSTLGPFLAKTCGATPQIRPRHRSELPKHEPDAPHSWPAPLAELHERHKRFDAWFRGQFGQGSEEGMIVAERLRNFLVGPIPSDLTKRAPYRTVGGSVVSVTRAENIVLGRDDAFNKAFSAKVRSAAERKAGGPLAALDRK